MDWLALNWFQLLTAFGVVVSWAVHYAISTQKWKATEARVDALERSLEKHAGDMKQAVSDIEEKMDSIQRSFTLHTNDSNIHVSPTLLQLFQERNDFMKKQFDETRCDIQRIESILQKQ